MCKPLWPIASAIANARCRLVAHVSKKLKALESGKLNGTAFKPSAAPVKQKELSSGSAGGMAVAQAEGSESCQVKLWHPRTAETNNTIPVWFPCMF